MAGMQAFGKKYTGLQELTDRVVQEMARDTSAVVQAHQEAAAQAVQEVNKARAARALEKARLASASSIEDRKRRRTIVLQERGAAAD